MDHIAQGNALGFPWVVLLRPVRAKAFIDIKLLPFQGVTNERALTQGVASLALGYVHHWAFSPSLLNPKLQ